MKKTSKIYVAGHAGLVGSAIIRRLRSDGYNNIITRDFSELDLCRQESVELFFEKEKPEYVFLAAAKVGGILANNTYKAEFIYDNMMIAANVIHASYKYGVKKLLNLGSSCIYPKFAPQPMKEDSLLTGELESTNEPYSIAKIAAIKLCRYYNDQYGTDFISVMPTNMYGPNDNYNLETSHVLPALIRKFHLAKLLQQGDHEGLKKDIDCYPIGYGFKNSIDIKNWESLVIFLFKIGITKDYVKLWGSGEPYREFLYVDDLVDAIIYLMKNYSSQDIGEFINIGTGQDVKIRELARLIKDVIGFEGEVRYDASKLDGTPRKLLDVSRMKTLGWVSCVSLNKGLEMTYYSYCQKKPMCQKKL